MLTQLWRESHSPEFIQRPQRFDARFPEFFAVSVVLYPRDAKLGGLLRKTVGEFQFCSDLQYSGQQNHRPKNPDNAGIRRFFQLNPIQPRATDFHGNPYDNPRAFPSFFKLRCIDQSNLPTELRIKWVTDYDIPACFINPELTVK